MKLMNQAKRYGKQAVLSAIMLGTATVASASTGFDAAAIGAQVATVITGFIALISAIGMAVITVVMAIQGFRLASSMVKTAK